MRATALGIKINRRTLNDFMYTKYSINVTYRLRCLYVYGIARDTFRRFVNHELSKAALLTTELHNTGVPLQIIIRAVYECCRVILHTNINDLVTGPALPTLIASSTWIMSVGSRPAAWRKAAGFEAYLRRPLTN